MVYVMMIASLFMVFSLFFLSMKEETPNAVKRMFFFVSYAPVIALGIVLIWLINSVHTDYYNRLFHAWVTVQFWAGSGTAYGCFRILKTRIRRILSLGILLSMMGIAIVFTPFDRYQHLVEGIPFYFVWMVSIILYAMILLISQKRVK